MDSLVINEANITEAVYDLLLLADPSRETINDYLTRGKCYTAYFERELIGIYVLIQTRPKTIEIVNIAVNPKYHKQGIGRRLIEDAIQKARNMNVHTIEIGTGNSSIHQLGLYQKCGFRICGIDYDFFIRHYDEEIYENGIQCTDMIRLRMALL
ncbi:GNAT family N-acetyltransferase [Bacillus solimangrovi]|uniref:GNAT family N-acetyltransferase n=1 Tax=Bacillus solimangrovi TaxID=1305675 RepID=UPI003CCC42ED